MINSSVLLSLYGGTPMGTSPTLGGAPRAKQPTAPWVAKPVATEQSQALRAALAGRRLIDESAARLDVAGASGDYRKLFALYRGLETLKAIADRAGQRGVSPLEQGRLAQRFDAGMAEIARYVDGAKLDGVRLVQGQAKADGKTGAAVPQDGGRLVTAALHSGPLSVPVAAFDGPVAFDVTVKRSGQPDRVVSIDLAAMGQTPRTLPAVVEHINRALDEAGVQTRFGLTTLKAEPRTVQAGGRTVTLPGGADSHALTVVGGQGERIGFSAAATGDAVYVVQGSGTKGGHELIKFDADPATTGPERPGDRAPVPGRVFQQPLPAAIDTARATATGPDGSLWVVADLGARLGDQPIKGRRDVALMRFDSAGRLVSTQTLGAADRAEGFAIAVAPDGRVAVAGSVVGGLGTDRIGGDPRLSDSFVTVFDPDGIEQWTQRRGARDADQATAVSFGADGQVHVAGRARSAMTGASALGGWDGYVQTFQETRRHGLAPIEPRLIETAQFGGAADDTVQAMTVVGRDLYTAGLEAGRAVVRRFVLDQDGRPALTATRDLGPLSGEIAGLMVEGGRVVVAGHAGGPLSGAGTETRPHAGGTDVFVASLDAALTPSPVDRVTYWGTGGDDTATDVKMADGKVWITGTTDGASRPKPTDPIRAHLTRIDPLSGAIEDSRTWLGADAQARPQALAVARGGTSALDRLGLPQGEIEAPPSRRLVDATALRAGDRFTVTPANGGRPRTITVTATDTLQTLAQRIETASGRALQARVVTERAPTLIEAGKANGTASPVQRLVLTTRTGVAVTLSPVQGHGDALAGLGLTPGVITPVGSKDTIRSFGLGLTGRLDIGDTEARGRSVTALDEAIKAVKSAYVALAPQPTRVPTGPVPAYQAQQLANYRAALERLGG